MALPKLGVAAARHRLSSRALPPSPQREVNKVREGVGLMGAAASFAISSPLLSSTRNGEALSGGDEGSEDALVLTYGNHDKIRRSRRQFDASAAASAFEEATTGLDALSTQYCILVAGANALNAALSNDST